MKIIIKPHHYIDIIKLYGSGLDRFLPDTEYQHAFYSVGNEILSNPNVTLQLTTGCDDICLPCRFKGDKNICQDVVNNLPGYTSKDVYNKMIDEGLINALCLDLNKLYISKEYCQLVYDNKDIIFDVWTVEDKAVTQRRNELFRKGCRRYLKRNG